MVCIHVDDSSGYLFPTEHFVGQETPAASNDFVYIALTPKRDGVQEAVGCNVCRQSCYVRMCFLPPRVPSKLYNGGDGYQ